MVAGATSRRRDLGLVVGLALGPAVALGLSRFAYGLLLPPMRTDLGWSYSQAGAMNTANGLGYLAGAVVTAAVVRRLGTGATYVIGMLAATVALSGSGLTDAFGALLTLRAVAGVAGALIFISGAVLVSHMASRDGSNSGILLGLYTAGAGVGTAAAAVTVQPLLVARGDAGWALAWLALGALSALCVAGSWPALRRALADQAAAETAPLKPAVDRPPLLRRLGVAGVAYLLFGLGYIAYVTFAVDYLQEQRASTATVTVFFAVLGLAAVVGIPFWGALLERQASAKTLSVMQFTLAVGAVLPLLTQSPVAAVASAALFGSTFLAVPAGVTHVVRRTLPSPVWPTAIGAMTVVFAAGQTVGPALGGVLADRFGSSGQGLVVAAATLTLGAVVNLGQRD